MTRNSDEAAYLNGAEGSIRTSHRAMAAASTVAHTSPGTRLAASPQTTTTIIKIQKMVFMVPALGALFLVIQGNARMPSHCSPRPVPRVMPAVFRGESTGPAVEFPPCQTA